MVPLFFLLWGFIFPIPPLFRWQFVQKLNLVSEYDVQSSCNCRDGFLQFHDTSIISLTAFKRFNFYFIHHSYPVFTFYEVL